MHHSSLTQKVVRDWHLRWEEAVAAVKETQIAVVNEKAVHSATSDEPFQRPGEKMFVDRGGVKSYQLDCQIVHRFLNFVSLLQYWRSIVSEEEEWSN